MDKQNQTFSEHILALSWNIATEPRLYRQIAINPYAQHSLQIIFERFPNTALSDVIRAVVLAEPEGRYDRSFSQLSNAQQEEELSKQRRVSFEINKLLDDYCNKYGPEISWMPKEFVYDSLSRVVFETADLEKIEQKYAQSQRRSLRLSIVDFIENTSLIEPKDKKNRSSKHGAKAIFATLCIIILLVFLTYGAYAKLIEQKPINAPEHAKTEKQILAIETQKENQGMPKRLIIPIINVDTAIEDVGLTPKGEMEVPTNSLDVGWFSLGPLPGKKGSAVISGHFNREGGEAGVFTDLHKLKEGDKLYIEDDKGISIAFIVRKSRTYDPGYADEVFSRNDTAHLNLITCDGVWDGVKKSYSKRLVVFADIEN